MVEFILPILSALGIGIFCRKKELLSEGTVKELKNLITSFFLPMMAFRMFAQAALEISTLVLFLIVFTLQCLIFLGGFALKNIFGEYRKYGHFLLSTAEGGMIGIGLYQMIFGQDALAYLAPLDLGYGIFYFLVYLNVLIQQNAAPDQTVKGSALGKIAASLKRMLSIPPFVGCLSGLVFQISGLKRVLENVELLEPLYASMAVFTAVVTPLMLVTIGYDLRIDRDVLGPVVKTAAVRLAISVVAVALGFGAMYLCGIREPMYYYTLAFEYSLPAGFLITMYVDDQKQRSYVNASLSFYVIVTLVFSAGFRLLAATM